MDLNEYWEDLQARCKSMNEESVVAHAKAQEWSRKLQDAKSDKERRKLLREGESIRKYLVAVEQHLHELRIEVQAVIDASVFPFQQIFANRGIVVQNETD